MIPNVWAVGRNYADHAKELGNAIPTSAPLIFLKAGSTVTESTDIQLPPWTEEVHHEIELALRLDGNLQIESFGLALDLTERKKQSELKSQGHPWTLAKSFTNSCPVSYFKPLPADMSWSEVGLELKVNGEIRQSGQVSYMIFPIPFLLDYIQSHFPVRPGDLILTGTPAGVGPIQAGDLLEGRLTFREQILIQKQWHFRR